MKHNTYILYSKELNKFYIGCTSDDIEERLRRHVSNHSGYTSKVKDWKIVYIEIFATKLESRKREMELKRLKSHQKIEILIKSTK